MCRRRLLDVMVLQFFLPSRATKSHNTWTTTRVSAHSSRAELQGAFEGEKCGGNCVGSDVRTTTTDAIHWLFRATMAIRFNETHGGGGATRPGSLAHGASTFGGDIALVSAAPAELNN